MCVLAMAFYNRIVFWCQHIRWKLCTVKFKISTVPIRWMMTMKMGTVLAALISLPLPPWQDYWSVVKTSHNQGDNGPAFDVESKSLTKWLALFIWRSWLCWTIWSWLCYFEKTYWVSSCHSCFQSCSNISWYDLTSSIILYVILSHFPMRDHISEMK